MQETVSFDSHGLKLSGVVRIPDNAKGKVPAFLLLHGFGSNKNSPTMLGPAKVLNDLGYVTLRFDMRGCGDSDRRDCGSCRRCGRPTTSQHE